MRFTPILLFVYNRPIHTQKVLDALALNKESKSSLLIVYSDGLKESASDDEVILNLFNFDFLLPRFFITSR